MKRKYGQKAVDYYSSKFRILKDWNIKYERSKKYFGQSNFNVERKEAIIYSWGEKNMPEDYFFHEILHIALASFNKKQNYEQKKEIEEFFIQDICKLFFKKFI